MAEEKDQLQSQILLQQIELLLDEGITTGLPGLLADQGSSDIAEVVELVDNVKRRRLFETMEGPVAAEVLEKVNEATRDEIFDLLNKFELKAIFEELDWDDAADLLAELEAFVKSVRGGEPPACGARAGMHAAVVGIVAAEAGATKKVIEFTKEHFEV